MKKRYVYMLLFGVPGLVVSLIAGALVFAVAAGVLWIFVFGDNSWPTWIESALPFGFMVVCLVLWVALLIAGYFVGRSFEDQPTLNKTHVVVSLGSTVLLILFILLYQAAVGNSGPKSDETRCSEYCMQKGFMSSSVTPRNAGARICGCLNNSGVEVITAPPGGFDDNP